MHQGAEGHAIAPAGREVLDVHVLGGARVGGRERRNEEGRKKNRSFGISEGSGTENISKVGATSNAAGGAGGIS